jgi:hypothetical protein
MDSQIKRKSSPIILPSSLVKMETTDMTVTLVRCFFVREWFLCEILFGSTEKSPIVIHAGAIPRAPKKKPFVVCDDDSSEADSEDNDDGMGVDSMAVEDELTESTVALQLVGYSVRSPSLH